MNRILSTVIRTIKAFPFRWLPLALLAIGYAALIGRFLLYPALLPIGRFLLQNYWILGILFSTIYTIGSVWWSVRVERRVRRLMTDSRVHQLSIAYVERDMTEVQRYLEKAPTGKFKSYPNIIRN